MLRVPPQAASWPLRRPKRAAATAVGLFFLTGLVAIVATGAAVAHLGSLLIGCVALGTFLASVLDRRTPSG